MKVVLFCGGLGMRMRVGDDPRPKPMMTVGDRPGRAVAVTDGRIAWLGDAAGAVEWLERSAEIFRTASAQHPHNATFRRNHAVARPAQGRPRRAARCRGGGAAGVAAW